MLARDGMLPERGEPIEDVLLSPRLVMESPALDIRNAVDSIQACVSGLSTEGRAGDALGLEWALIARGASTVLASHWNISFTTAVAFFERFYCGWLANGLSRAQASRRAMLTLRTMPLSPPMAWSGRHSRLSGTGGDEMDNSELLKRLEVLAPIQQVALCQAILARLTANPEAIRAASQALDPGVRDNPSFLALAAEASTDPAIALDKAASAAMAKTFLLAAATDPDFSPLAASELAEFRDEKQFVVEVLALGAAVSMIIIAASTRFEYRKGAFKIIKEVASPELVKEATLMIGQGARNLGTGL